MPFNATQFIDIVYDLFDNVIHVTLISFNETLQKLSITMTDDSLSTDEIDDKLTNDVIENYPELKGNVLIWVVEIENVLPSSTISIVSISSTMNSDDKQSKNDDKSKLILIFCIVGGSMCLIIVCLISCVGYLWRGKKELENEIEKGVHYIQLDNGDDTKL